MFLILPFAMWFPADMAGDFHVQNAEAARLCDRSEGLYVQCVLALQLLLSCTTLV